MGMAASLVMWPIPFEVISISPFHESTICNLALIGLMAIEEKEFKNIESEWLSPRSMNDLDL